MVHTLNAIMPLLIQIWITTWCRYKSGKWHSGIAKYSQKYVYLYAYIQKFEAHYGMYDYVKNICRSAYIRQVQMTTELRHIPALHPSMQKLQNLVLIRPMPISWMWIIGSVTPLLSTVPQVWRELRQAPNVSHAGTWSQLFWPMIVLYLSVSTHPHGRV